MQSERGRWEKNGGTLLKGAAVLGLAAVVSKLLGTLQKIPLQNIAGDEVFGIYHAVYPLYILILTLATAGFPIAVSKFVADHAAKGELAEARRVFRTALSILTLTGILGFALLYTGADAIAEAIGMKSAAPGIRSVSYALLVAPAMSAVRGFFQGLQDMVPTAVSQVAEQFVRVAVMIILLLILTSRQAEPAVIAAGAAFGSTAGALGGMAAAVWYWLKWRRGPGKGSGSSGKGLDSYRQIAAGSSGAACSCVFTGESKAFRETKVELVRRFIAFAVPICLGSIALPALTLVDAFTVPRLLLTGGLTEAEATHRFGLYNHGMPLVQLVTMVAASMSAALIPSVSEAAASGDARLLEARTAPVLRFTWMAGLASAFGLAVTSWSVNVMFFESPEGWRAMSIVAFTALFGTLHVVTGCMLQGLGAVTIPARNLFVAAGVKAAGNLLLVPAAGIEGAAAAAVLAYGAAAALNLRALRELAPRAVAPPKALLRPLGAAVGMSAAVLALEWGLLEALGQLPLMPDRLRHTAAVLAAVIGGAAVYTAALFRLGGIDAAELAMIPGFDTKWKPVLKKLRLLPQGGRRSGIKHSQ